MARAAGTKFILYVSGQRRSRHAIENVRRLLRQAWPNDHELTVVDVMEQPETASMAGILATPTLTRAFPAPGRRLIGDFGDADQVLAELQSALHPG